MYAKRASKQIRKSSVVMVRLALETGTVELKGLARKWIRCKTKFHVIFWRHTSRMGNFPRQLDSPFFRKAIHYSLKMNTINKKQRAY